MGFNKTNELGKAVTMRNRQMRRLKKLRDLYFDKWIDGDMDDETHDKKCSRIFGLMNEAERWYQQKTDEYKVYWY